MVMSSNDIKIKTLALPESNKFAIAIYQPSRDETILIADGMEFIEFFTEVAK